MTDPTRQDIPKTSKNTHFQRYDSYGEKAPHFMGKRTPHPVDSPTGTKQRPRKTSRSPLKRVCASIGPQQHKLTTKGDAPARQPAEQERPMSVRYIITRGRQEMCAKWPNLGRLSSNFVPRKAQELLYPPSPVSNALGRQRGSNDGHVRELLPKSWMLSQKHQDRLAHAASSRPQAKTTPTATRPA